jgi:hypothetical protein
MLRFASSCLSSVEALLSSHLVSQYLNQVTNAHFSNMGEFNCTDIFDYSTFGSCYTLRTEEISAA